MPAADPTELAAVPVFASLSAEALDEVAARFEARDVGPGVRLLGQGTTGSSFFVLREGTVSVTIDGEEVASLGPGEFFGEIALLGPGRRVATVTTTSPVRLLVSFADQLRDLRESFPGLAEAVEAAMRDRLAGAKPAQPSG